MTRQEEADNEGVEGEPHDNWVGKANLCQCLTTASVESIIVPSMSKRRPEKVSSCGGPEKICKAAENIFWQESID